jgi:NADH-ubiquinone oxidoreductase chain 5
MPTVTFGEWGRASYFWWASSVLLLRIAPLLQGEGCPYGPKGCLDYMLNLIAMLIILAIFSIFFGYITKDVFIGVGTSFFNDNSLFTHPTHEIFLNTEFGVPTIFKLLPFICTVVFTSLSLINFEWQINFEIFSTSQGKAIYGFLNQRFLVELLYNKYISGVILKLGGETTKILDKGSIELIGPFGLEKNLLNISSRLSKLDVGVLTTYALYIFIGLIFYNSLPFVWDNKDLVLLFIITTIFMI